MVSTSNKVLPGLKIKRKLENIIHDWGYKVVDQFTAGVQDNIQVWVTNFNENYEPLPLNNKILNTTLTIDLTIFTETNESGVSALMADLFNISPDSFVDIISINKINPINTDTTYNTDSTDGHILGAITLEFNYLFKRGA